MKEPVHPRGPNDYTQFQFDAAEFSPQNLEDTIVLLINGLFEEDIRAVSSLDFKEDTDTEEPIIVVTSGDLKLSKIENGVKKIEFGIDAYEGSVDNGIHSEQSATGTLNLNLVARTARGTTLHSYELLQLFQELQYFMSEMIGVLMLKPVALKAPKKIEDTEHLWQSTVQCEYKIARAWNATRIAPRLKTFGVVGLANYTDPV